MRKPQGSSSHDSGSADPASPPSAKAIARSGEPLGPLVEGVDYYVEHGLYVFTAHYLRRRGYCCQSGCRHCPYDPPGGNRSPARAAK